MQLVTGRQCSLNARKAITQAGDALKCLGCVHTFFFIPDTYQHKIAQLETRRGLVAFGELRKTGRN